MVAAYSAMRVGRAAHASALVAAALMVGLGWMAPAWALVININPGATLAANQAALDAFNRAAASWEALFTDPVTVNIDADLGSFANPNTIGAAGSVTLTGTPYNLIRDAMVLDAADEADDGIVAFLPTGAQFLGAAPTGFTLGDALSATKANLKALGFTGLDAQFGANDATITFNQAFNFDFDNSDGVGGGLTDFETVAAHEIGHALGFVSVVDTIDVLLDQGQTAEVTLRPLDLFRFADVTGDPENFADFTSFARNLVPGAAAFFDDLDNEFLMSSGVFNGDGRQASHWKDNGLTGTLIGVLDPTLAAQQIFDITAADIRAFDLIGWDFLDSVEAPAPGGVLLFLLGIATLGLLRARHAQSLRYPLGRRRPAR